MTDKYCGSPNAHHDPQMGVVDHRLTATLLDRLIIVAGLLGCVFLWHIAINWLVWWVS